MAINLVISSALTGLAGALIVPRWGAAFAMFFWMMRADTPERPTLGYPWLAMVLTLLLPLPLLYKRQWQLASVASLPFALVPFYQLYVLYLAATPVPE